MRGQTSLPALGVALVVLVTATLFAVSVAEGQLATARGDALERETALAVSERLVGAGSSVTARQNVVRADAFDGIDVTDLRETYGLGADDAIRVTLGGEVVLATGEPEAGTTVERLVRVQNRTSRRIVPRFDRSRRVTLPRRSPEATLVIDPAGNATVETVLANGAVLLRDTDGLAGRYEAQLSRYETVALSFEGTGSLSHGDITVRFRPARTRTARLRVTVQRWGDADG